MKDLLIKIKNFSIITIIASFVIGLVLLIWPNESITAVSILTGVTTILLGVTAWISYFAKEKSIILATAGTVCIIIGVIICVKYQSIIAILLKSRRTRHLACFNCSFGSGAYFGRCDYG